MAFPITSILDNFNRANGPIGSNWTDGSSTPTIVSNECSISAVENVNKVWNPNVMGVEQEVYFTITDITVGDGDTTISLLLKNQSISSPNLDYIILRYSHLASQVDFFYFLGGGFNNGGNTSVSFANGDQIGATIIGSDISLYKNGTLVQTWDASGYTFIGDTGYIGFRYNIISGDSFKIDDFGGGTIGTPRSSVFDGGVIS